MKPSLTPEKALQKIRHYCAYQERCHAEVRDKLYSMGLHKPDVETLLTRLIEEDYLNETRFAIQFAGGHFRMKQWGRVKILHALQQKRLSAYSIKAAMKEIGDEDYMAVLQKLARTRWNSLRGEQYLKRQAKTTSFLLGRGYESALVQQAIQDLKTGAEE